MHVNGEDGATRLKAILGLSLAFQEDEDPRKISVGVGAYRDEAGKPYVLPSVRKAEQLMLEKDMNHEYLGITGDVSFNKLAPEFLFGENSAPLQEGRVAVSQVLSGTGGLRVAFEFIKRFGNSDLPVLVPGFIGCVRWGGG